MKRQMKKALRSIVTLGMAALLTLAAAAGGSLWAADEGGATQDVKPGTAIGVAYGLSDFTSQGYGSGGLFQLALTTRIAGKLYGQFMLGRTLAPVEAGILDVGTGTAENGKLSITPLTFSLQYRYEGKSPLVPYILIGVGFYLYHFAPEAGEEGMTADVAHRMALHVGAGLDYFVSRHVGFGVDVRYTPVSTFVQPYSVVNPFPNDYPKIHLDTLAVTGVVKYYF